MTDMSKLFYASGFNAPINQWNTSQVTNMHAMFQFASWFNQPIDQWNTSNVTNMCSMFKGASSFNQPITMDTSQVTNMSYMFSDATSFNQPITMDFLKKHRSTTIDGKITKYENTSKADTSLMFHGATAMLPVLKKHHLSTSNYQDPAFFE